MFRNTFAVEMLRAGWLLEPISILLGRKCVRVIAKHYAPWGYGARNSSRQRPSAVILITHDGTADHGCRGCGH